ncbi:MAG TPA: 3'(2'),5'-bisphosphate nucleotidase CysQ [Candidatus Nanoarchaeia archaeon]|nr:3'(2'),5'-bisphosphate nucleotidase CysQ [Candidatus Nanoarchaeia archaeon]
MTNLNLDEELETAKGLAEKAGKEILRIFYSAQNLNIETKTDHSPVTIADKTSNEILIEGLSSRFPNYGILSEETLDNSLRLKKEFVWIIDPLDGTRDFIARQRSFTIIVGLARLGEPVLGVVHSPLEKKTYSAVKGKGAYLCGYESDPHFCGRRKLDTSPKEKISEMRVLIVRKKPETEGLEQLIQMPFSGINLIGGAGYKSMIIAEGLGEVWYHRGSKCHEWDLCAPSIIVEEAGGQVTDLYGNPLRFNKRVPELLTGVLISNGKNHMGLVETLAPLRVN